MLARQERRVAVFVPQWNGWVLARGLTGSERLEFDMRGEGYPAVEVVASCLIAEDGRQLLAQEDRSWFGGMSYRVIETIYRVAMDLSGLGDQAFERCRKRVKEDGSIGFWFRLSRLFGCSIAETAARLSSSEEMTYWMAYASQERWWEDADGFGLISFKLAQIVWQNGSGKGKKPEIEHYIPHLKKDESAADKEMAEMAEMFNMAMGGGTSPDDVAPDPEDLKRLQDRGKAKILQEDPPRQKPSRPLRHGRHLT